jgi:hypothetical protein
MWRLTPLTNPGLFGFQVFISNDARKFWGIANAHRVIGYDSQDDAGVQYWKDIATYLMQEG